MNSSTSTQIDSTQDIYDQLTAFAQGSFGTHPFAARLSKAQLEVVLPELAGVSLAFRYLQAAAQKDVIFDAIRENRGVPDAIELMNGVGNFLAWDETGGNELMLTLGKAGLPSLLDSARWFHSNILRTTSAKILGHPISPHFNGATQRYLMALYRGLASTDVVRRCAHMVAFELNASVLIDSLWSNVARVSGLPREELEYFHLHMGGPDPAEKYHTEMTQRLIARVVPPRQHARFLAEFQEAYELTYDWCAAVTKPLLSEAGDVEAEVWHRGACHCRGVQFKVLAPRALSAVRCNCSICAQTGFLHLLVRDECFCLLSGAELLTTYQFNLRIAKHTFCSVCGTKPFYRPRSSPSDFSVNVRCLDRSSVSSLEIDDFDGDRWEENIHHLDKSA